MSWGALFLYAFCGCIAGYAVAQAQINLHKSKKLLVDAAKIKAAAQEEFERWRKASEALERISAEIKFGGVAAAAKIMNPDPFMRPPGCLCREVVGGRLKVEEFCPVHIPRRPP